MPRKRAPKKYVLNVVLSKELHEKIHKIADKEDRSAGAVLRRMIDALPDPEPLQASA